MMLRIITWYTRKFGVSLFKKSDMYYVYVLQSLKDKILYTGFTRDINKRIIWHNDGKNEFTAKFIPWKLIYYEAYLIKEDAINREKFLKSGSGKRYLDRQLKEFFRNHPRRKIT